MRNGPESRRGSNAPLGGSVGNRELACDCKPCFIKGGVGGGPVPHGEHPGMQTPLESGRGRTPRPRWRRLFDEEGEVVGAGSAAAVADDAEHAVGAAPGRRAHLQDGTVGLHDALRQGGRGGFLVAACFAVGAFGDDLPVVDEGIVFGVAGLGGDGDRGVGGDFLLLEGGVQHLDAWAAVFRPAVGPCIGDRVNRGEFFSGGEEHAIPCRGGFLLLPPEESEGAEAAPRVVLHHGGVRGVIMGGFVTAGGFDRRPPGSVCDLPMADGAELGEEEGLFPAGLVEGLAYIGGGGVGVDAEDIEARVVGHERADLVGGGTGDDSGDGVVGVFLVHDPGEFVEFFPDADVLIVAGEGLHFVAETPDQEGGVVPVFANDGADGVALGLDLRGIAVIETVALVLDPDAGHDTEIKGLAAVEEGFPIFPFVELLGAPGADGGRSEFTGQLEMGVAADSADLVGDAVFGEAVVAAAIIDDAHDGGRGGEQGRGGGKGGQEAAQSKGEGAHYRLFVQREGYFCKDIEASPHVCPWSWRLFKNGP